jgi:hypothetical protein
VVRLFSKQEQVASLLTAAETFLANVNQALLKDLDRVIYMDRTVRKLTDRFLNGVIMVRYFQVEGDRISIFYDYLSRIGD